MASAAAIPGCDRIVALAYVQDEDAVSGRRVLADVAGTWSPATIEGVAR